MSKPGDLYDEDFVRWTEQQAAALRQAKILPLRTNLPLDWDNLAEEIESLGKSDRRELHSQIRRILRHLLKLAVSPAESPRRGWHLTIREARKEIVIVLRDSPSLRREIDEIIADEASLAAEFAAADLDEHGELTQAARDQIDQMRFTAEQVLGDWFPPPAG
jgi:Uri superfamily endonuclease